ncbi:MAG TPA: DUF397 domain-containing protein [Pseudonocardiaceae bacterium]|nr:DUF397 domain-containing protein [Pseudonocardiaceae bacterium]
MVTWRKSSHSGYQNSCVELAGTLNRVRDSKNPKGSELSGDLVRLVTAVKAGWLSR